MLMKIFRNLESVQKNKNLNNEKFISKMYSLTDRSNNLLGMAAKNVHELEDGQLGISQKWRAKETESTET